MDVAIIYTLVGYLVLAYLALNLIEDQYLRDVVFAFFNVLFCGLLFFYDHGHVRWGALAVCGGLATTCYLVLRYAPEGTTRYALSVGIPVVVLIAIKSAPLAAVPGLSYLTFRLAYLGYEVHAGKATVASVWRYLGFAFFPLTFPIGPISPFRLHDASMREPNRENKPITRCLLRMAIGAVKIALLAELFRRTSFKVYWFEQGHHGWPAFLLASASSYLYLYLNFSGACDLIIGAAALLEIDVKENFDNPLLARNIREFWNRFHITLADCIRDLFFTPGLLTLSRRFGPKSVPWVTALMLMVSFFLVGLWHGTGRSFIVLGLFHGVGMSTFYVFSLAMKKAPRGVRSAIATTPVRIFSTLLTFAYVSVTSIFFHNDWEHIVAITNTLLHGV